jgi:serine/threonine protein kinase
MKIIYRDLKPENSLVTGKGYFRLVDFGTAKFLKKKNKTDIVRTFTIIGSP